MSVALRLSKSTLISALGTSASYALVIILANNSGIVPFGEFMLCLAWASIMVILIDCAADAAFTHLSISGGDVQTAFNIVMTIRVVAFFLLIGAFCIVKVAYLIDIPWQVVIFLFPAFNLGTLFEFHRSNVEFSAIICMEKIVLLMLNYVLLLNIKFEQAVYFSYTIVIFFSLLWQGYRQRNHILALRVASAHSIRSYFEIYWPLLMISLAQISYGHISRLVIEGKQGTVVFASVSLAFQVVAIASIIQSQVDRIFRPMIIETVGIGDAARMQKLIVNYLIIATLPMVCCAIVIFSSAQRLIYILFGPEYQIAGDVLQIISPMFVSVSLIRLTDLILLALNQVRLSLVTNVASALLMLLTMQSFPAKYPLALFIAIVVCGQFAQAALGGMLAIRTLKRGTR